MCGDFWFTAKAEDAAWWESKEKAESQRQTFDRYDLSSASDEGGFYIGRNFGTEEVRTDRWVVFCEAPFLPYEPSAITNS